MHCVPCSQIIPLVQQILFFFFSSRRRHTRLQGDWSSDVCSSDLYRDVVATKDNCNRASTTLEGLAKLEPVKGRSEEHTSELQSPCNLVCRLLLEKKKKKTTIHYAASESSVTREKCG